VSATSLHSRSLSKPIQVGDAVVAIGGKGTVGRSLREVQNMLLGPPGSALTLAIATGARDPVVSQICVLAKHPLNIFQDITLIRAKVPPLVRSGNAGVAGQPDARAIARDMLAQAAAPRDPVLPFDDTWIQEIKVRAAQPALSTSTISNRLVFGKSKHVYSGSPDIDPIIALVVRSLSNRSYDCFPGWQRCSRAAGERKRIERARAQPRDGR
jgi:hypothetical protein